jgi:tRNA 2-thiouridine synthesizing protein A
LAHGAILVGAALVEADSMSPGDSFLKHVLPVGPGSRMFRSMSETVLDVKGMNCPLPVLKANRALRGMPPGARLRVLATDRAAVADFQAFCRETGHALLAWSEDAGIFSFLIRRREADESQEPRRKAGEPQTKGA